MHWYKDGQRYVQLTKKGVPSQRINTKKAIADGAGPGVTDVISCLQSPGGLIDWKVGHAFEYAVRNPPPVLHSANEDALVGDDLVKAQVDWLWEGFGPYIESVAGASRGTEIHAGIDDYFAKGVVSTDPVIVQAYIVIEKQISGMHIAGNHLGEVVFSHVRAGLSYGGTIDIMKRTRECSHIIDLKTITPKKEASKKWRSITHEAQVAGYGLWEQYTRLDRMPCCLHIAYVSQETGNLLEWVTLSETQTMKAYRMFIIALEAWWMQQENTDE